MIRPLMLAAALLTTSLPGWAGKNCEEFKSEISTRLSAKGVARFTLEIVPVGTVKPEDRVVGSCEAGSKQITYRRG